MTGPGVASTYQHDTWDWLLHTGRVPAEYGGWRNDEHAHLLDCGLDATETSGVDFGSFTRFTGTFAEDKVVQAVTGRATCVCGEVEDVQVVREGLTVPDLIGEVTRWASTPPAPVNLGPLARAKVGSWWRLSEGLGERSGLWRVAPTNTAGPLLALHRWRHGQRARNPYATLPAGTVTQVFGDLTPFTGPLPPLATRSGS